MNSLIMGKAEVLIKSLFHMSKLFHFFFRNCTPVLLTQNLFHQNKAYRCLALNMQSLFLMRNPRDSSAIIHLSKQICPYQPGWLAAVYSKTSKSTFGYLFMSFHQKTPDLCRYMTRILPLDAKPSSVFIPG